MARCQSAQSPPGVAAHPDVGGNLQPGETPPESDQVSAPQGQEHGPPRGTIGLWIVAIAVVVALVATFFVGWIVALLD